VSEQTVPDAQGWVYPNRKDELKPPSDVHDRGSFLIGYSLVTGISRVAKLGLMFSMLRFHFRWSVIHNNLKASFWVISASFFLSQQYHRGDKETGCLNKTHTSILCSYESTVG
jgi:hypothetical protein